MGAALMGEHPIQFTQQCQPGEIASTFEAPGRPHPERISELIALAQCDGDWLPQYQRDSHG